MTETFLPRVDWTGLDWTGLLPIPDFVATCFVVAHVVQPVDHLFQIEIHESVTARLCPKLEDLHPPDEFAENR
jgi:hypothetical protein